MAENLRVPPDLNEGMISHVAPVPAGQEDKEVTNLMGAIAHARESAQSLAALQRTAKADRTLSPESAALRVRAQALRNAERIAARLDAARAQATVALETFERTTAAPPPPRDAAALALEGEIRANLKNMTERERKDILAQAFVAKDETIIGAVLRGPAFLSGLSETELERRRHDYRKAFFPAESAAAERRRKALEAFDRAGGSFMRFAKQLTDDPLALRAEGAQAEREEAEAALSGE